MPTTPSGDPERRCPWCKKLVVGRSAHAKFCSGRCRDLYTAVIKERQRRAKSPDTGRPRKALPNIPERHREPARDLTGQTFGSLTVLHRSEEKGKWVCRCSCGETVVAYYASITHINNDKCYCYRRKRPNCVIVKTAGR
jgi:hypothetical protein